LHRNAEAPVITVAIATHNRARDCLELIGSLRNQSLPRDQFEIIVADNGSTRDCQEELAKFSKTWKYRLIVMPEAGISAARNALLAECHSPLIAYIDDDARPIVNWLRALLNGFASRNATVVGGPIRSQFPQSGQPDWLTDELLTYYSHLDYGPHDRVLATEFLVGANMAFRCANLRRVGGFQLRLGRVGFSQLLGDEEVVVQNQIRSEGGCVLYASAAAVSHIIKAERLTPQWLRSRVAWQAVSAQLSGVKPNRDATGLLREAGAALGITSEVETLLSDPGRQMGDQLRFIYALQTVLLDPATT
jgi:GT2 family glycosyltransferase